MKKSIILAGNYGSGKTELSLNMAIKYSKLGKTALADMDIVNPYFRSAEHGDLMKEHDIRLIIPTYANTTVDVPVISAEVFAAFNYDYAIFDAGGDPVGASVLGSLKDRFSDDTTEFLYVINARRPFQRNSDEAIEMMYQIQEKVRRKITGLINNTNLARETTPRDIMDGQKICDEITSKTGLETLIISGEESMLNNTKGLDTKKFFPIKIFTRPPWLDITADEG